MLGNKSQGIKNRIKPISIILLLVLSIFSGFVIYSPEDVMAYTNPYGTIEYWAGGNQINITGNSSDNDAWNFYDIWHWCNVDIGGNETLVNTTDDTSAVQFLFNCKLVIGDGSTETWFKDTNKQVTFADGIVSANTQIIIDVKNNAHFQLGILSDATKKETYSGCSIIYLEHTYVYTALIKAVDGAIIYLYSSSFSASGTDKKRAMILNCSDSRVWNCIFVNCLYGPATFTDSDIYNIIVEKGELALNGMINTDVDRIYGTECTYGIAGGGTFRNMVLRDCTYAVAVNVADYYLIDCDIDTWNLLYWQDRTVYRQYTFNIIVQDSDGNPIQNANVLLKNVSGNTIIDDTTDASGVIYNETAGSEYVVTYAFYNQTGGNTPYLQGPHNLTIAKAGYATFQTDITIDHKIDQDIFTLGGSLYQEIIDLINEKWGNYNATQLMNYLINIDANLTSVYNLLQLVEGNVIDAYILLNSVDGNITLLTDIVNYLNNTRWNNLTAWDIYKEIQSMNVSCNLTLVLEALAYLNGTRWGQYTAWDLAVLIGNVFHAVQECCYNTTCNLTEIVNLLKKPFASFSYAQQGCKIIFADESYDIDGWIVNWSWNFDDGNTSYEQNPTYWYGSLGIYNATLTVRDNDGYIDNVTKKINVTWLCPFPPMLISPANNSRDVSIDPKLVVHIYDPAGSPLTVTFYQFIDGTPENDTVIGSYSGKSDRDAEIVWNNRNYGETYQWYATVNDGTHYVDSGIWTFTITSARLASSSTDIWGIGILLALVVAFIAITEKVKTTLFYFLTGFISMSAAIYVGAIGLGGDFDHLMLIIFAIVMMIYFLRMGFRARKDHEEEV